MIKLEKIQKVMELLDKGDYATPDLRFFFTKGENGEIVYDPDKSGNPDQVSRLTGTSFSPLDFIPRKFGNKINQ